MYRADLRLLRQRTPGEAVADQRDRVCLSANTEGLSNFTSTRSLIVKSFVQCKAGDVRSSVLSLLSPCPSIISPFHLVVSHTRYLSFTSTPLFSHYFARFSNFLSVLRRLLHLRFVSSLFDEKRFPSTSSTGSLLSPRSPTNVVSHLLVPAKGQQYESLCAQEAGSSPSNAFERRFNTNQSSSYRKLSASWPSRVTSF